VPLVAAIALLLTSRQLGALNAAMSSSWLIRAQTYRLAGFVFLYPFLYYGLISAAFALPAALGDMLTGALAPIVGRAVDRRSRHAVAWAVAWNVFGIVDLIVAPAAALASGARLIEIYPLAIVALFIGPPLGILTHLYSLRNLVVTARRSGAPGVRIPAAARQQAVAVGDRLGA
jgi:hypothetical protein